MMKVLYLKIIINHLILRDMALFMTIQGALLDAMEPAQDVKWELW